MGLPYFACIKQSPDRSRKQAVETHPHPTVGSTGSKLTNWLGEVACRKGHDDATHMSPQLQIPAPEMNDHSTP